MGHDLNSIRGRRKAALFIRKVSGSSDLDLTLRKAVATLYRGGIPSLVVGGYAVQEHGYPRFTQDIDLVVPDVAAAREYLSIRGFRPNPGSSMTLTDRDTKIEVDLLPAGGSVGPGPVSLPQVHELTETPNLADLPTLVSIKLSSYLGNPKTRLKDAADVQELLKAVRPARDLPVDPAVLDAYQGMWDDLFGAEPVTAAVQTIPTGDGEMDGPPGNGGDYRDSNKAEPHDSRVHPITGGQAKRKARLLNR